MTPGSVPQQADGHIRTEILLNCAHHVQDGPAQDAHGGGTMARAQAAAVLPELQVQAVPAPGGHRQ